MTTEVPLELAEAEFDRFAEMMDLDFDLKGMDDNDRRAFLDAKRVIVRAMQRGSLVVDEDGQPVFTPQGGGAPITFYEPDGAVMMAADQKRAGHDVSKMYALMTAQTKELPTRFAKMKRRDSRVCEAVAILFFG